METCYLNPEGKLSTWKGRLLSMGGRVALINSILTNLLVYHLSFFKALVKYLHEIISIQRNFLWKGFVEKSGIAWISWKSVCKSKEEGGLDIKDVSNFNRALLSKWLWWFLKEDKAIWVGILQQRYGNLRRRLWFNEGWKKKSKETL